MAKDKQENFDKIKSAAIKMAQKLGEKFTSADNKIDEKQVQQIDDNLDKMNKGPLAKIWDKVMALYSLLKSPDTPFAKKAVIFGGLLYLVMPFDVLPDFIFPLGLMDDVAVITFIFLQCKDLLQNQNQTSNLNQNAIPISTRIKDAVHDITSDAVIEITRKQFRHFSVRTFINAFLRLSIFSASLTLFLLAPQNINVATVTATVLLVACSAWILFTVGRNIFSSVRMAKRFFPEYKKLMAEAKIKNKKIVHTDIIAQSFYNSIVAPELKQNVPRREKIIAFLFRSWNEGKLQPWVYGKKELVEIVWNAIKIQVAIFFATMTCYVLVYNLFVTHLLAENVTSLPFWFLVASPFKYAWWLATSGL